MSLNERIAQARRAAGLSQEQLGEALGVSRQAVSKWESGQTRPDLDSLSAMCELFHLSADYLLLGREDARSEGGEHCPKCGRFIPQEATCCPDCCYPVREREDGRSYALLMTGGIYTECDELLQTYCGLPDREAREVSDTLIHGRGPVPLLRHLSRPEVLWKASLLSKSCTLRIVEDGELTEDSLRSAPEALPCPGAAAPSNERKEEGGGLGFGGTVIAVVVGVIVALLLLALF